MSDVNKDLIGTWNVAFKQYRFVYTFTAGGGVTWRDIWGSSHGAGKWVNRGSDIQINWTGSTTKETWDLPINLDSQTGTVTADYASGQLTATKDKLKFDAVAPEGQRDAFACWAACLAWYTRAVAEVQTLSQIGIIGMSDPRTWAANGSITLNGLMTIPLPNVMMTRKRMDAGALETCIRSKPFPMLIAFASGPLGGHVNVIHRIDGNTVMAMEPWFPDPQKNQNFSFDGSVYSNKTTGDPFKFTGQHISRPLTYYTSKPLSGQFIVGCNSKYSI